MVRRFFRPWLLFLLCLPFGVLAQYPFREAASPPVETWADGRPLPRSFRAWHFDRDQLLHLLADAPDRFAWPQRPGVSLLLPDAGGVTRRFLVWSSPVMAPDLAARYPGIRTWFGVDADFPARRLLLDHGPKGLHAMITCPGAPDQFLDPWDRHLGVGPLIAYARNELSPPTQESFQCHTAPSEDQEPEDPDSRSLASDNHLRTYRLALACTGEYGTFHGGTIPSVLAAMATTLHRINGIYERDFGIRMELVADNDQLIFLNPATDPFDNGDIGSMLPANQQLCDNTIGSPNYDIGHVFGTAGGGLATLFGPCNANTKARAATGLSNPAGEPFDVDYAAHEIGHQFGGNHTFNNSCSGNRNNPTAWEPGSGSTIMAYAGICTPNVQSFSDAYFHGGSQAEVRQFTVNGNGNTCPQLFPSGNLAPQVDAGPDRVIPHSTPFVLEALASDPDGDLLSYCWEQFNPQIGAMPPMGTNAQGPLFRSLAPDTTPHRIFPALTAILQNQAPTWEVLPAVARNLQFRITVRDNHPLQGRWVQDAVQLTVSGESGPFRLTHPNTSLTWLVGDTVTVTWEVAGTDQPPVNSPRVDIALSTDGGFTYPIVLGQALPNTGQASVLVPWVNSDLCRVRIMGHDHIFFDLSDEPFSIREPDQPSFLARGFPEAISLCGDAGDSSSLHIALQPLGGMADTIQLSWTGPSGLHTDLPAGFFLDQADTLAFRIWFDGQPDPSGEPLEVLLQSASQERRLRFDLSLFTRPNDPPLPVHPEDGQDSLSLSAELRWSPVAGATVYRLELASSPGFGATIFQVEETSDTLLILDLSPSQIVYWRVLAGNPCGMTEPGAIRAFRTLPETCRQYNPEGLPLIIPEGGIFAANSTVDVPDPGRLTRVEVDVDLAHGNLGQVTLRLSAPGGLSRNLVNKACIGQQDIQARFSDKGQAIVCSGLPPAIMGMVRAQSGPIDLFSGLDAAGTWTFRVIDDQFLTGGQLNAWFLHLCTSPPVVRFPEHDPDTLWVPYLGMALLDPVWMADTHLHFMLRSLPKEGQLERDGIALAVGDQFTGGEIAAGLIRYRHDLGPEAEDAFLLDVLDTQALAWLPAHPVMVRILTDIRVEVLEVHPVRCTGEANGKLLVQARNGLSPWEYRMYPAGDWQSDSLFTGLSADSYRFEVRDAHGFPALSEPFILAEPDSLKLLGLQTGDDQAQLIAEGGRPPYRFRREEESWQDEPWFAGLVQGMHTFTVEDSSGCQASVTIEIQVSFLEGSRSIPGLAVYPNPARDWLHIRVDPGEAGLYHWQLSDALGRTTAQGSVQAGTWTIPTGGMPAGWYVLEIGGRNGHARVPILLATER